MSKFTTNIFALHNNIFSLTPVILSFYQNYNSRKNDILLSYLILPIVLNPLCKEEIKRIRHDTPLTRIVRNKKIMAGFPNRFELFKGITNDCIQYAIDCKYMEITDDLRVKIINTNTLYTDKTLSDAINLASKLSKLFNKDIIQIYYAFGIKRV